jgi:hypothetical protein
MDDFFSVFQENQNYFVVLVFVVFGFCGFVSNVFTHPCALEDGP